MAGLLGRKTWGAEPIELNVSSIPTGLHNIERSGGVVTGVNGKFDVGLDDKSAFDAESIEAAVTRFVLSHREWFSLEEGAMALSLAVRDVELIDGYFHVARIDPYVRGLRVLDAELVATFWSDGDLHALRGQIVVDDSSIVPTGEGLSSTDEVLAAIEGLTEATIGDAEFVPVTSNRFEANNASIEKGWSNRLGGVAWVVDLFDESFFLDDEARTVVSGGSSRMEVIQGSCNVRLRRFPTDGSGRVNSLAESNATRTETLQCLADDNWFTGNCAWKLRRDPFGFAHGVQRVLDANGAEQNINLQCNGGGVPQFTGTNGDALREQGAFYVAHDMRTFTLQNVWSTQSPLFDPSVQIEVDSTVPGTAFFSPSCALTGVCPDIRCNTGAGFCTVDVLAHEYGHYVHWSLGHMGQPSNPCTPGVAEAGSLNETLANAFALNFLLDDPQSSNAIYAAPTNGGAASNFPNAHTNATVPTQHAPNCNGGPNNDGFNDPAIGQAFLEAFWETMYNRNCTTGFCNANSGFLSTGGGRVFTTSSQEAVIGFMGDALGHAIKTTPEDTSHQAIVGAMGIRLFFRFLSSDPQAASRAMRVFVHHGFQCPLGSVGC